MAEEDPHLEVKLAQAEFMTRGGVLQVALTKKFKSGELSRTYVHQEFPKCLNIPLGTEAIDRETEIGNGSRKIHWTETRQIVADLVVQDRVEEADTLDAIERADELGIAIDPTWTAARLRDVVAQAELAGVQPRTVEDRKAARIEALRRELAALEGGDAAEAEGAAPPAANPLLFATPSVARRPHRRTRGIMPPAASEPALEQESTPDQAAA